MPETPFRARKICGVPLHRVAGAIDALRQRFGPAAAVMDQEHIFVLDPDLPALAGIELFPAAVAVIGERVVRHPAPGIAGLARRQDVERTVVRRGRLDVEAAAHRAGLDDRV